MRFSSIILAGYHLCFYLMVAYNLVANPQSNFITGLLVTVIVLCTIDFVRSELENVSRPVRVEG